MKNKKKSDITSMIGSDIRVLRGFIALLTNSEHR